MSEHSGERDALVEKGAEALFNHFHGRESRWGSGREWPAPEQHLPWWRAAASAVIEAALGEAADAIQDECRHSADACFCGSADWLRARATQAGASS